jgi:hypothetical protein
LHAKQRGPQIVWISCTSSASAIAGKRTTSQGSCPSTRPTKVVFLLPLHDQHDGPAALVVLSVVEGMVEPLIGRLPLRVGKRLLQPQRIVDQNCPLPPCIVGARTPDRESQVRRRLAGGGRRIRTLGPP